MCLTLKAFNHPSVNPPKDYIKVYKVIKITNQKKFIARGMHRGRAYPLRASMTLVSNRKDKQLTAKELRTGTIHHGLHAYTKLSKALEIARQHSSGPRAVVEFIGSRGNYVATGLDGMGILCLHNLKLVKLYGPSSECHITSKASHT